MRTTLLTLALAGLGLAQSPEPPKKIDVVRADLTNEEKLAFENASLKLQLIKAQEKDIQAEAQKVFESACKRAGIDLPACRFNQAAAAVEKAEPVKPEVKK